jgi:peptide subunit release factor 1 (eRF1)
LRDSTECPCGGSYELDGRGRVHCDRCEIECAHCGARGEHANCAVLGCDDHTCNACGTEGYCCWCTRDLVDSAPERMAA